jgi:hypothetical protein
MESHPSDAHIVLDLEVGRSIRRIWLTLRYAHSHHRMRHLTPELTGRAFNVSSIQVSRMKATLFALRLNELLDVVFNCQDYANQSF